MAPPSILLGRGAILLDALGTLVSLEPPAPALVDELRARFGLEITRAEAERAIAAEIGYYRRHFDEGKDERSVAALRARCAEALRAALPPRDVLARLPVAPLTEALLAALRFSAFPDAAPALSALRGRGHRLVVVSNWDASLPDVLRRGGLASLLDGVVTSAQAGARKPSPVIFTRAMQIAGSEPEQTLHVGDTVEDDVTGALAAGIGAVLIRRGPAAEQRAALPAGVRTIESLIELCA